MNRLNLIDEIANVYVPYRLLDQRPQATGSRCRPTPRKPAGRRRRLGISGFGAAIVAAVAVVAVMAV